MARIQFDDEELAAVRRALMAWLIPGQPPPRMFPVLAIDPGKASMGWAYADRDGRLHSGQGSPDEVVRELDVMLDLLGPPMMHVFEGPYTVTAAQLSERKGGGLTAIRALARATGYVHGGLRRHLARSAPWEPMPSTWRAVLGLNRKRDLDMTARDATAQAVLTWVRATTKKRLVTEGGKDCIDEAMACAMVYAALSTLTNVMFEMRGPRPQATPAAPSKTAVHPARKKPRTLDLPGTEAPAHAPER